MAAAVVATAGAPARGGNKGRHAILRGAAMTTMAPTLPSGAPGLPPRMRVDKRGKGGGGATRLSPMSGGRTDPFPPPPSLEPASPRARMRYPCHAISSHSDGDGGGGGGGQQWCRGEGAQDAHEAAAARGRVAAARAATKQRDPGRQLQEAGGTRRDARASSLQATSRKTVEALSRTLYCKWTRTYLWG